MSSVQDHVPVIKELSEKRQQDPQPAQATQQQIPSQTRDPSDSPRAVTLETSQRESSPPRFSQVLDPLPEASESDPPRRGPSTATNSTLVGHSGTVSNPTNGTGQTASVAVGSGGAQNVSVIQDRGHDRSTSLAPDRRPIFYDPIRGEGVVHVQLSDDGEYDRRAPTRRVSLPRPRPIFSPLQDGNGNGNGNGPRIVARGASGTDSNSDPREPQPQPQPQPQHSRPKTVQERIQPTLNSAIEERKKYKRRGRREGILINGAIALQVIAGAVTTGVAAGSKNVGTSVAVLGGFSTALASYLAKARGSGEPELSNLRSRELNTFIREVEAFIMDKGHEDGSAFDIHIAMYRERFELIIKTEGEDSTSGTGYATHARPNRPANFYPGGQQGMAGMYDGRQYQIMPPQPDGRNGHLTEKQQMWKNEKALSAMV